MNKTRFCCVITVGLIVQLLYQIHQLFCKIQTELVLDESDGLPSLILLQFLALVGVFEKIQIVVVLLKIVKTQKNKLKV